MPDAHHSASEPGDAQPVRLVALQGLIEYGRNLRALNRNVRLFLTVTAFRGMAIATLQTVLNLYLYSLGFDAGFIGFITAINALATLLISFPLGYCADHFGRRPVLLVGGIAYPLSILGIALSSTTVPILVFNFIFGGAASAYWVAGVPLLFASTRPKQRVQAFSLNSFLLWGLGPLGAFLSGQIVEVVARLQHVSPSGSQALRAGVIFMGLLAALGAVPYLFLSEPERARTQEDALPSRQTLLALFAKLLVPDAILAFGLGSILTFSQLYFHVRFQLDPGPIGLIVAVGGIVSGVATLLTPLLARSWGNLRTVVRLQWFMVPILVVLAVATRLPVALLAYGLVVTLRGMVDPVYNAFIQERAPDAYRSRLTGLYSVTYAIGYSLGPGVSGQIQQWKGFTLAFVVGAAFYLLGATLLHLFFGSGRQRAELHAG